MPHSCPTVIFWLLIVILISPPETFSRAEHGRPPPYLFPPRSAPALGRCRWRPRRRLFVAQFLASRLLILSAHSVNATFTPDSDFLAPDRNPHQPPETFSRPEPARPPPYLFPGEL